MPDLSDVQDVRRVKLAPGEKLAVLVSPDTYAAMDTGQWDEFREALAEELDIDVDCVVVVAGVNDLVAVSGDG